MAVRDEDGEPLPTHFPFLGEDFHPRAGCETGEEKAPTPPIYIIILYYITHTHGNDFVNRLG